ncbi:MAG: hypothetical protein ACAI34_07740 [Verrucomicrobium sp.]|nr:hypothetical protein [Verrucomicrobium sp.]
MRTLSVANLGDSIRAGGSGTIAATAPAPKEADTSAALASASETASPASGSESESAPGQVTRTPEAAVTAAPRAASVGELRQPTAETPSPAPLGPTAEPRSAAPLTDAEMQVRFLNVVRDWGEALVQGDYAKLVGCMPADYVKSVGGAEELAKQLTVVMKMFRASGLKIRDFLVGEVSPVSVEKNALAVLVPTFLGTDLKDYPKGGTLRGYLVGVSYDKGLSWKVVDNEVAPPSEVRRLMPELAGMTEVPVPGNSLMEDLNASVTAIEKREGRPIREYIQELMKKGEADSPAPSRQSAGQVASSSRASAAGGETAEGSGHPLETVFRRQADAGNVTGVVNLATQLLWKDANSAQGRALVRQAALQGFTPAQRMLSRLLLMDESSGKDTSESWLQWMDTAALQGDELAQLFLGELYIGRRKGAKIDNKQGLAWLLKAAEQGNPRAQSHLGWIHFSGKLVPKSEERGRYWFKRAADQGDTEAESMYGSLLGVRGDHEEALKYASVAANYGNAVAQYQMGLAFKSGSGEKAYRINACMWLTIAARDKSVDSSKDLKAVMGSMSKAEITEARKLAEAFRPKPLPSEEDSRETLLEKLSAHPPKAWAAGFCLREDGYFLTSHHVASAGRRLYILDGLRAYVARCVKISATGGYALLKADATFYALEPTRSFSSGMVAASQFVPGNYTRGESLLSEIHLGYMLAGDLALKYLDGMAGSAVRTFDGQAVGMVLPPSGSSAALKGKANDCRLLPASDFPSLPPNSAPWNKDRTWRGKFTEEDFTVISVRSTALVVAYE